MTTENLDMDYSKYDFKDSTEMYVHLSKKGLTKDTVREISQMKEEPEWMLNFRLRSYDVFMKTSYALSLKSSIHSGSSFSLLISLTVSFDNPFLLRCTYISVESLKSYLE